MTSTEEPIERAWSREAKMTVSETDSPSPQQVKDSDIAWLCSLKEDGHCGEGSLELKGRTARNDRIDRILSALSTSSARVVELEPLLQLWLDAFDTGRSEPLYIARDATRSALHPEGKPDHG